MLTTTQVRQAQIRAEAMLDAAGIALTASERQAIEVVDFGLGTLEAIGLQLVVYAFTDPDIARVTVIAPEP